MGRQLVAPLGEAQAGILEIESRWGSCFRGMERWPEIGPFWGQSACKIPRKSPKSTEFLTSKNHSVYRIFNGEGGIRTHGAREDTLFFKTKGEESHCSNFDLQHDGVALKRGINVPGWFKKPARCHAATVTSSRSFAWLSLLMASWMPLNEYWPELLVDRRHQYRLAIRCIRRSSLDS